MFRLTALVLIVAALGGCHRDGKADDQRTASGQVLAGSISDSMIPYEQLQSRPPLAPRVAAKGATAEAAVSGDGADSANEPADPAVPAAPAATSIPY